MSAVLAVVAGAAVVALNQAPSAEAATQLPPGFAEQVVWGDLNMPTNIEFAPDGRVFVAEKGGVIKVFDNVNDTDAHRVRRPVAATSTTCTTAALIGMAIHPEFPVQPYIYVLYTYDAPPVHERAVLERRLRPGRRSDDRAGASSPGGCPGLRRPAT